MNNLKFFILIIFLHFSIGVLYSQKVQKVVIDAGHGGKDSGTVARSGKHKHEKTISLAIAKKLGSYIKKNYKDVKVIYTRTKDVYLTLNKRAKIANNADADLFISIHVDAVGNKKVSGSSVYVLGLHRTKDNLKVAMRENAVMMQEDNYKTTYEGFDPKNTESYIIFSLMQNQYLNNSMTMASFVDKHLKQNTKRRTKGVKQAGFYVLREVGMPSILVETGYITNTSDADFLCSTRGQDKTAYSIFKAFADYKKFIEEHTSEISEVKNDMISSKRNNENIKNTESYYTIQLAFSSKDMPTDDKYFKKLNPIFKEKEKRGNRYTFGKTKSYKNAKELLRKAKLHFSDAFIIGYHNGELIKASELRSILNGN